MRNTGNIIVDTVCHTPELGLNNNGAADCGEVAFIDAQPITFKPSFPAWATGRTLRNYVTRTIVDLSAVGCPVKLRVCVLPSKAATRTGLTE